ncbi:MAG: O-methyltransferase [Bacteroidales bacterium]|jgi:predicted O-methyltransferase YrrM|nr:O-methyltransferase [Bacteroidales bacterium]
MIDLLPKAIEEYCEAHTSREAELLHKIYRHTHLRHSRPRMLSGQLLGELLAMFVRWRQPRRVLEVGAFTGYATISMAWAMPTDAILHTIEKEDELEDELRAHFKLAGVSEQIMLHVGAALEIIPRLNETWDFVLLDADKTEYLACYELLLPRMSSNALILADNVLWSGKVIEDTPRPDKETLATRAFNQKIQEDPRVRNLLLPFRDGLMIIEKL